MSFKEDVDKLTEIIESCFDWENEDDNKSFDERLHQKLQGHPNLKEMYDANGIGDGL